MFVELHLLQNFAPSNLNRDDTNSPKDCEFGGHRRARISSQCIKRAIRRQFKTDMLLPAENLAHRTKRLIAEITDRLKKLGKDPQQAQAVAGFALKGIGLGLDDDGKTQYLIFLGEQEIQKVSELLNEHWDELSKCVASAQGDPETKPADQGAKTKKTGKDKKKEAKEAMPPEIKKMLDQALDGGRAADLGLFGRMLADLPGKNIEGACQVAHALSTNKVSMEMDYYTAVDDLQPEDTAGAGMIGSVEFNSACFYRYSNIDLEELRKNLQGDGGLVADTVKSFLQATMTAIPTGKQHSMAAHNPPSLVLAVVRDRGLWSLANAFEKPIRPDPASNGNSLVQNSIEALDDYWGKLTAGYGEDTILAKSVFVLEEAGDDSKDGKILKSLKKSQVGSVKDLIDRVMTALQVKK